MEILVFKTNLQYKKNIKQLMPHLDELKGHHKMEYRFS